MAEDQRESQERVHTLALSRGLAARLHGLSHFDPQFADGALANQLALLLLERSNSLYQVPQYEAHVHRCAPPVNPCGLHLSCSHMAPALCFLQ